MDSSFTRVGLRKWIDTIVPDQDRDLCTRVYMIRTTQFFGQSER